MSKISHLFWNDMLSHGLSYVDFYDYLNLIAIFCFLSGQFGGEMSELDDAGTYFDLGPKKVTGTGTYFYMSTRNNNFSNRSQKGRIILTDIEMIVKMIGRLGGSLKFAE